MEQQKNTKKWIPLLILSIVFLVFTVCIISVLTLLHYKESTICKTNFNLFGLCNNTTNSTSSDREDKNVKKEKKISYEISQCMKDRIPKRSMIDIEGSEDSITFNQKLRTFCNTNKDNLTIEYFFEDTKRIKITETFDAENVTKCECTFEITGTIPNLTSNEYTVDFIFYNKYLDESQDLGSFSVSVGQKSEQKTGFCGISTYGTCSNDSDCIIGGCSGQVCESKNDEPLITTCEWKECYDSRKYNIECKCIENKCTWK